MSNSVQLLRRLLTSRNLKGVISQAYSKQIEGDGGDDNKDAKPPRDVKKIMGRISDTKESIQTVNAKAESTINDDQLNTEKKIQSETDFNVINKELTELKPTEGNSRKTKKKKRQLNNLPAEFERDVTQKDATFTSLLRQSSFIDIGDPVGKVVVGKIFQVVDNDLYIDFGWKFHTVCKKPKRSPEKYTIGAKVFLVIKDLELTARFLGDEKYISLLEADCEIVTSKRGKSRTI